MKRSVLLFTYVAVLLGFLIVSEDVTAAEINDKELQQYLVNINWSTEELVDYLQFYDLIVADFDSLAELQDFLGTPITNENLKELLGEHEFDHHDLDILLAEYGETLNDYMFIEDLDFDVKFFLAHQEEFSIVNDFVSLFGLTELEMQKLFKHFNELEELQEGEKLELAKISTMLEELAYLKEKDDLSAAEQEQLFLLWDLMLEALNVDASFFLVKEDTMTQFELKELINLETLNGFSLQISLYKLAGEELATLVFNEEMLDSHLMYESLEQISEVVKMSDRYRERLEIAKLPKTAGNFVVNIVLSIVLIIIGFAMLTVIERRAIA